MTTYYVDSSKTGGTDTGGDWTNAFTDFWSNLATLVDADLVIFAHNHVEPDVAAAQTLQAPAAAGNRAVLVSATQNSEPPVYQKGAQLKTTGGAYQMFLEDNLSALGMVFVSGAGLTPNPGAGAQLFWDCDFKPGSGGTFGQNVSSGGRTDIFGGTIDNSADTSTSSNVIIQGRTQGYMNLYGVTYIANATYKRNGSLAGTGGTSYAKHRYVGCDFSALTSAITLGNAGSLILEMMNCKLPATFTVQTGVPSNSCGVVRLVNCSTADTPELLIEDSYYGSIGTSTTVYRNSSGEVEGTPCSYVVNALNKCTEQMPYASPWLVQEVDSTGSVTFSISIANNTAALENDEVWLEIELPGSAGGPEMSHESTQRAYGATPAAYATDAGTWSGSPTYKQTISKTLSVGRTGQFRARLVVARSSLDIYTDPLVVLS